MTITARSKSKTTSAATQTYTALRTAVRQAIQLGKERATQAVEREKVRTSWEIGKLILEHILLNQSRADYGAQVVTKLTKDLKISRTELNYMIEFARAYPIVRPGGQLSWSHYQKLLSINDADLRNKIAKQAELEGWTRTDLQHELKRIKKGNKVEKKSETLRAVTPGALDVFRTREVNGKTLIDLGFSTRPIII